MAFADQVTAFDPAANGGTRNHCRLFLYGRAIADRDETHGEFQPLRLAAHLLRRYGKVLAGRNPASSPISCAATCERRDLPLLTCLDRIVRLFPAPRTQR